MPDYANPASITLVFGQGSSGKTTFVLRLLLNAPVACRFVFDDRGQCADRLKITPCGTAAECEAALPTRWVVFNPHVMLPGPKLPGALRWFATWAMAASQRGPGRKIFFVDEAWQWWDARNDPPDEIENLVRTGRLHGLDFVSATHSPREFHRNIRRLVTEWVGFNTVEPDDLHAILPYWPGVYKVATLPKFQFLAYNRETGLELGGKL